MAGQFIVIDALGADFQIGHQISYEGSKIINETLNRPLAKVKTTSI
ncbi:hypothetical protein P647_3514 [Acinetobacter baumannii UH12208]|nr:hypothetical protein P647_3514 [Acinetobacter baumannii UH12208]ETQ50417.1 hypothetical protein P656_2007 [Acinetobacter baumannii UH16208]ETQ60252.1 hypothetical protein P658_3604 [Acinetobacter baumannii UH19608]